MGKQDNYYVYQGVEEKEINLNTGFKIAKELLEFLHSCNEKSGESVTINILYQNEELSYYLKNDASIAFEQLQNRILNCEWIQHSDRVSADFAKKKTTLRGGVSPLVVHQREENLIDELVKVFPKEEFFIQFKLATKQTTEILEQIEELEKHINELHSKVSEQVSEQSNILGSIKKNVRGGENISYEKRSIKSQLEVDLLENHLYTLKTQGRIFSSSEIVIYGSEHATDQIKNYMVNFSRRSGSLLFHHLKVGEKSKLDFLNYVPINYMATLLALPLSGVPGVHIDRKKSFSVDLRHQSNTDNISMGHLITYYQTKHKIEVALKDLTKHVFVTGITGSGKTSTIKSMLHQLQQSNIPFLVIEPAKTEYQFLKNEMPGVEVYKLGIQDLLPFKLNPFYFPKGIHLQTHLDHLKSVFIAAFPMYGPMPYILETAIYNIYRRKGWDFVSGINIYEGVIERNDMFPTLEDLYLEIDDAIDKIGYSQDLSSDVRGALKVRIGSLLGGSKGMILNTKHSINIEELLSKSVVIELEKIGDDQEKVFLMGLLLISIYEHYIAKGKYTGELQHLLVIEEAHRLLENTKASNNAEIADVKGKAVETFNHILSEIRAYGQSICVADQIPSKLSPDIIKNTNLKIIHRLFSKEDRELVGHSIGLEDEEIKELIRLRTGEAVIFHGGLEVAMKTKVSVAANILAADQQMVTPVPVEPTIDINSFILYDEEFRHDIYKKIREMFLFRIKKDQLENEVVGMIQMKFPVIMKSFDKESFWRSIIDKYITENKLTHSVNFDVLSRLLNELQTEVDPLGRFLAWQDAQLEDMSYLKMIRLAPLVDKVKILQPKGYKLGKIVFQYWQDMNYLSEESVSLIINNCELKSLINVNELSFKDKQALANGVMLLEFVNEPKIIERYFGFQKL